MFLSLILSAQLSFATPNNLDVIRPEKTSTTHQMGGLRWSPTNFKGQGRALGYRAQEFAMTPDLKERVDFWIDIYSKYTSSYGIIHDRTNLNIVYAVIDFSPIISNSSLTLSRVERAKTAAVKRKREEIYGRLSRLKSVRSSDSLDGEDLRIWNMFPAATRRRDLAVAANKEAIRFQLGQKDFFKKGIYYSGRYLRQMESIFRKEGLPIELTRLPFVESSFNIYAQSKVGASGIWQFMRGTGKSYLKINSQVDERNDPLSASRAAAKLLRSNYRVLRSWPLAITAYNHGPTGTKRLVQKYRTRRMSELIDRAEGGSFGFASKNFYACFLAALEVEANANKYFGPLEVAQEVAFETYVLSKQASYKLLLNVFGYDTRRAELLNPHFTAAVKRGRMLMPKGSKVRIPPSKSRQFVSLLSPNSPKRNVTSYID
ncbi:MAG: lytic transglycosylase domain-containing protein [Bdellovibrionales bacterium]